MERCTLRLLFTLLAAGIAGVTAAEEPAGQSEAAPGRIIMKTRAGVAYTGLDRILQRMGVQGRRHLQRLGLEILSVPARRAAQIAEALGRDPRVEFAELDRRVAPAELTPNDPKFQDAWHLRKIGAPQAWPDSRGDAVTIAILDSGVNASHPDLAQRMVPGWNVYSNTADSSDVSGHGTKVAGAAAATLNNGIGVAGVAGQARIMPIRVTDSEGYAYFSTLVSGLEWASLRGARVANMSFLGLASSSSLRAAAREMLARGGLVMIAAGNTGRRESYSASEELVAVSATNRSDSKTSWSSYGDYVDLSAPGVDIWTTNRGGGYGAPDGTSFSSPVAAGVAALVMAADPNLSPTQVLDILQSTATDLGDPGFDIRYGHGRVDAAAAVAAATATGSRTPDTTPPEVAVTTPAADSVVSGLLTITVEASDEGGLALVSLQAGGETIASAGASPLEAVLDTTTLPDGELVLGAYAEDAAGNGAVSQSVSVTVDNTFEAPDPGRDTDTDAEADSDADGLNDGLEVQLGLNPNDPNDAELDLDGDGYGTRHELLRGTDPLDPDSLPARIIMSSGQSGAGNRWSTLSLAGLDRDSLIIAGPPTAVNAEAGVIRLQTTSTGQKQLFLQEWDYLDGSHGGETLGVVAVRSGRYQLSDGTLIEAGSFPLDGTLAWQQVRFTESFPTKPYLWLSAQTYAGKQAVTTRARQLSATGFQAALFEQESYNNGHYRERIAYLAVWAPQSRIWIPDGTGSIGCELLTGAIDHNWTRLGSMEVRMEEEQSADLETRHLRETVQALECGALLLAQDVSSEGINSAALRRR